MDERVFAFISIFAGLCLFSLMTINYHYSNKLFDSCISKYQNPSEAQLNLCVEAASKVIGK